MYVKLAVSRLCMLGAIIAAMDHSIVLDNCLNLSASRHPLSQGARQTIMSTKIHHATVRMESIAEPSNGDE